MEEEIDMLSEVDEFTSFVEEYEYKQLMIVVIECLEMLTILIGVICNVILIYIIARNKRMRSRTNIILLNWCISNILLLITPMYGPFIYKYLANFKDTNTIRILSCANQITVTSAILSIIFISILITPKLMKSTSIQLNVILGITYTISSFIFLAQILSCVFGLPTDYIYIPLTIIAGCVCITVIIKDANRCRKKYGIPTSDKTLERFNIAKIHVYNGLLSVILEIIITIFILHNIVPREARMLNVTRYLTSLYICTYLYKTNNQFKICMLNLFKFNSRSYADATITFDEDSDGKNSEHFKVNLNINSSV